MEKEKQELIDKIIELTIETIRLTYPCCELKDLQKMYIDVTAALATAKAANELLKKIEEEEEK